VQQQEQVVLFIPSSDNKNNNKVQQQEQVVLFIPSSDNNNNKCNKWWTGDHKYFNN
jgi:hypothetical protein